MYGQTWGRLLICKGTYMGKDVLYTEREVADILRVNRALVAKWRLAGEGPPHIMLPTSFHGRPGVGARYYLSELDAWLATRTVGQRRTATSVGDPEKVARKGALVLPRAPRAAETAAVVDDVEVETTPEEEAAERTAAELARASEGAEVDEEGVEDVDRRLREDA